MGKYRNAGTNHGFHVPLESVSAPAFAVVSPLLIAGNDDTPGRHGCSSGGSREDQRRLGNSATSPEPAGHDYNNSTVLGCGNDASLTCAANEKFDEYGSPVPGLRTGSSAAKNRATTRGAPGWGDNVTPDDVNTAAMLRNQRRHLSCKSAGFDVGISRTGRSRPASCVADSASQGKVRRGGCMPLLAGTTIISSSCIVSRCSCAYRVVYIQYMICVCAMLQRDMRSIYCIFSCRNHRDPCRVFWSGQRVERRFERASYICNQDVVLSHYHYYCRMLKNVNRGK